MEHPQVIGPVKNAKTTLINNYADAIYVKAKPLVLWNGHDAIYFNYVNYGSVGTRRDRAHDDEGGARRAPPWRV